MNLDDLEPDKEYYITFYSADENIIKYNGIYQFIRKKTYVGNKTLCTFINETKQSLMLGYNNDNSSFSGYFCKMRSYCFCDISELTNEYVLK